MEQGLQTLVATSQVMALKVRFRLFLKFVKLLEWAEMISFPAENTSKSKYGF
jgi:hypothetical protein